MNAPVLTIVTRHLVKRDMSACLASIEPFRDQIQHLIVPDSIGVGWAGSIKNVVNACHLITGKFVWLLDDDDVCTCPDLPRQIAVIDEYQTDLQIIISRIGLDSVVFPCDELFYKEDLHALRIKTAGMANLICRQDIFKKYIPFAAITNKRDHDWWMIDAIQKDDKHMHFEIYWWDMITIRQPKVGNGVA